MNREIVILFFCALIIGASSMTGYKIGYSAASDPQHAAKIVGQEMLAKSALQRAITSSIAEAQQEDFLTDMCKDDPKQCEAGKATIGKVK